MNEKEKIFNDNTQKYGGIFLDYTSEEGKYIEKRLEEVSKKINEYYNDKKAVYFTPEGVKSVIIKNKNPDASKYHPYINVYCVNDDNEINAFAKKIDQEYYVGILKPVFDKLSTHIEDYVMDEEFSNIPEIGKTKADIMVKVMTEYCMDYLIFHEFFHIINGHCDYGQILGINELCEVSEEYCENSMIRQTLEYDADCCAIASIVNEFFRNSVVTIPGMHEMVGRVSIDSVIQFIGGLLVAIYIITSWMNMVRYTIVEMKEERLEKMTHPLPGMRVLYMWATVSTVLSRVPFYNKKEKDEIIERSLNTVFDFIDRFKWMAYPGYLKQSLDTASLKHIQKVHDNWKEVREKLTIHYGGLAPYEEFDVVSYFKGR